MQGGEKVSDFEILHVGLYGEGESQRNF